MDAVMKQWIDNASYQSLLRRWRFSASGDPIFQGEIGKYYTKMLAEKRSANPGAAVAASKAIGWER